MIWGEDDEESTPKGMEVIELWLQCQRALEGNQVAQAQSPFKDLLELLVELDGLEFAEVSFMLMDYFTTNHDLFLLLTVRSSTSCAKALTHVRNRMVPILATHRSSPTYWDLDRMQAAIGALDRVLGTQW